MAFPKAMQAIIDKYTVTRLEWANLELGTSDRCQLRDGWLMICRNGTWHQWLVNDGDIMARDWIIVKE